MRSLSEITTTGTHLTVLRVGTNLKKPGEPGKRHFFGMKTPLKPGKPGKLTFSPKNGKLIKLTELYNF